MLSPDQSSLVIVDSVAGDYQRAAVDNIVRLLDSAQSLSMPVHRAQYPNDLTNGALQAHVKLRCTGAAMPIEPDAADWREVSLAAAIHATGRRKLLIVGLWLEEAISLLALQAIRVGLDGYVCIDACLALQPDQTQILQSRLIQHGVVVTTTEQAVREWVALAPTAKRGAAQRLLDRPASHS